MVQDTRIVHVIVGLNTGGAEKVLYTILENGSKTPHHSVVISLTDKGKLRPGIEKMGVAVHEMGFGHSPFDVIKFYRLVLLIRKMNPSLVVGWMYHSNIVVSIARLFLKRRVGVIWNIRHALHDMGAEHWRTRVFIRLGAYMSRYVDRVIFNSNTSLKHHKDIGYSPNNAEVIANGFDAKCSVRGGLSDYTLHKELGLDESIELIGMLGRFHEVKGHRYFIEASKRIGEEYPNVHFVLVGRQVDEHNQLLKKWLSGVADSSRYHLLGERRDIERIICSLKVLVSASTTESFPNVIGEAMVFGVPCVATNVGDVAEIVSDTGIIVGPKSTEELYTGISQLLSWDQRMYRDASNRARERIDNCYSKAAMVNQHEQVYEKILGIA